MVRRGEENRALPVWARTLVHDVRLFGIESDAGKRNDCEFRGEEHGQPRRSGNCRSVRGVACERWRAAEEAGGIQQSLAEGWREQRSERERRPKILVDL